jgi:hypothetical protein
MLDQLLDLGVYAMSKLRIDPKLKARMLKAYSKYKG